MPYNKAFLIPSAFDLLFFVKKLTVIGIIGNTQGVSNAAKPLKNEIMKIRNIDLAGLPGAFLRFLSTLSLFTTLFFIN